MKHEGIKKLFPVFSEIHYRFHGLGNRYFPWLIPETAIRRCFLEEISPGEAARSLQVELATLLGTSLTFFDYSNCFAIALAASVACLTFAAVLRLS